MSKRKQTPDVLAEILGGEAVMVSEVAKTDRRVRPVALAAVSTPAKWEYCLVTFQDYKGWRPRYIDGRELKDWTSGPPIHEYLASMGEEGWELAAASAGERLYGSSDNHQLFFKRLK